ncbi:hypothetical protein KFL_003720090 [Klebsormidium nitens]|uniref:YqaJ viral recombinase domain-containing protein n=1 Tax=Klebsormidium nitens TaxID=105231 RepID=A0A1Y1IHV4_KLENI|nr:hypothetical protein KFL_003720090 [Klebsormidium nitens]|eukprot:GAQ87718.1 hypothetical protein KFL_003720090 [Klebsormidium nitens]
MATSLLATYGPHRLLRTGVLSKQDSRGSFRHTASQGSSCTATCQVGRQVTDTFLQRRTMFHLQRAAGARRRCAPRYLSTFARAFASPNPQAPGESQARPPFPPLRSRHPAEANSTPDHSHNGSDGNGFRGPLSLEDTRSEAPGGGDLTPEKRPPVAAVLAEMRQRLKRANGKRAGTAGAATGPSDGRAESSKRQAAIMDVTRNRERPHLPAFKHAPPIAVLSAQAAQSAVEPIANELLTLEAPSLNTEVYQSTPSEVAGNGQYKATELHDRSGFDDEISSSVAGDLLSFRQSPPQSLQTQPPRTPPSVISSWSLPPSLFPGQKPSKNSPVEVRPENPDAASSSAPPDSPNGPTSLRRLPPMKLRSRSLFRRKVGLGGERSEDGAGSSGRADEGSRTLSDRSASSGENVSRTAEPSSGETGGVGWSATERNGSSLDESQAAGRERPLEGALKGELEGAIPLTEWMHAARASEPLRTSADSRGSQPLSVLENAEEISCIESADLDVQRLSLDADDDALLTEWLGPSNRFSGAPESEGLDLDSSGSSSSSQQTEISQTEVENGSQTAAGILEAELRGGGGEATPLTEWLTPSGDDTAVLSLDESPVSSSQAPLTEWRPETGRDGVGGASRASSETRFRLPIPLVEPTSSVRTGQRAQFRKFLPKVSDRLAFRGELLPKMSPTVEQANRTSDNANGTNALGRSGALDDSDSSGRFSDGAQSISDAFHSKPQSGPPSQSNGAPRGSDSASSVSDGPQSFSDVAGSLSDASRSLSDGSQAVSVVSKSLSDAFSLASDGPKTAPDGPKSASDGPDEQRTPEWYALRRWRLTASAFASAVGFFPEQRLRLWEEKLELREPFRGNQATVWGTKQETPALEQYARITGNQVTHQSFQVYKDPDDVYTWLGASPDGLMAYDSAGLGQGPGVLEVKCPFGREGPEIVQPYPSVPFYYIPQVQGLLEIFDRQWADFFVWTVNGSVVFRVERDPAYWALLFPVLSHFWWQHVVPAKHELVHGRKDPDYLRTRFEPQPKDVRTELIIAESKRLSARSPAIWTDSGRVRNGNYG